MFQFARWLGTTPPSMAIKTIPGLAQLLQVIHLLTVGVVLASLLLMVLHLHGRPAGYMRGVDWRRLSRSFWCAMAVMAATGIAFILGEPLREISALSFWIKLVLLVTGCCAMLWLGRRMSGSGTVTPAMRRVALGLLVTWIAVGMLGRFIGYDIPIWGAWSPRSHL